MVGNDLVPRGVIGVGIIGVAADVVGRERAVVVRVGLAIRHPDGVPRRASRRPLQSCEAAARNATRRSRPALAKGGGWPAHRSCRGESNTPARGRSPLPSGASFVVCTPHSKPEAGSPGFTIGIDRLEEAVVLVVELRLDAVESFAIDAIRLAADGVRNAGRRHQIALVGGVDIHLGGERAAGFHGDRIDTGSHSSLRHVGDRGARS